jgi:hypothetical protein
VRRDEPDMSRHAVADDPIDRTRFPIAYRDSGRTAQGDPGESEMT